MTEKKYMPPSIWKLQFLNLVKQAKNEMTEKVQNEAKTHMLNQDEKKS